MEIPGLTSRDSYPVDFIPVFLKNLFYWLWCQIRFGIPRPDFHYQQSTLPEFQTWFITAATAKSLQSCLTLCDSIDGSLPGSLVLRILQARTLEWVAISFSNAWKWKAKVKLLSRVWPSVTPWTASFQASPSMGFSRQDWWSWVSLPSLHLTR